LPVSVVGIGTWQFGGEWGRDYDVAEVRDILDRARELGINLLDTAECYGDHVSERLIGEAIEGRRDEWFIATKFGHRYRGDFQRDQLWSADEVLQQLDASLEALRTDYVDLYQFHSGTREAFDDPELWSALAEQVKAGRIRHLGISISENDDDHQASRARAVGAEALQVVYNRLDRKPERHFFPASQRDDLGVLARVPLASGYLSGRTGPTRPSTTPATCAPGTTRRSSSARSRRPNGSAARRCRRAWTWRRGRWRGACSTRPSPA
jgi:aryl-alcohol dehydrogenase-like predicted oxidoreductase